MNFNNDYFLVSPALPSKKSTIFEALRYQIGMLRMAKKLIIEIDNMYKNNNKYLTLIRKVRVMNNDRKKPTNF